MIGVDALKASLRAGHAKMNRYNVIMPVIDGGPNDPQFLSIMCDSVTLPGRQIFTHDVANRMKEKKVAYSFDSQNVNMSFMLDNNWFAWDYINRWHGSIIINNGGIPDNYRVGYKNDYSKEVEIQHLDVKGNVRKAVALIKAFPVSISPIEMGNSHTGEITMVEATFVFDDWELR